MFWEGSQNQGTICWWLHAKHWRSPQNDEQPPQSLTDTLSLNQAKRRTIRWRLKRSGRNKLTYGQHICRAERFQNCSSRVWESFQSSLHQSNQSWVWKYSWLDTLTLWQVVSVYQDGTTKYEETINLYSLKAINWRLVSVLAKLKVSEVQKGRLRRGIKVRKRYFRKV